MEMFDNEYCCRLFDWARLLFQSNVKAFKSGQLALAKRNA